MVLEYSIIARKISLYISKYIPIMRLNKERNVVRILKPVYTVTFLDSKRLPPK